ncbi:MAG: glycosyltransferase family 4 protein [Candidatus Omnitrophica bacterium]|nr:glycosyltransferase family 4 protein [Candidatus Omnitrophota bacterium]
MKRVVFAFNSGIGFGGQGIALQQAIAEFHAHHVLHKVYCYATGKNISQDIPVDIFKAGSGLPDFLLRLPFLRKRQDLVFLMANQLFERFLTQEMTRTKGCDLFISTPGHALDTMCALKSRYAAKVVIYSQTTHIAYLFAQLVREDATFAKRGRTHFVHEKLVEQVCKEYERCDYIFVVSKFAYDTFRKQGIPEEKLRIVRPGVDLSRFVVAPEKENAVFRICFCGLACLRKGFQYLLQAVDELGNPDIEIVLVGASGDSVSHKLLEQYAQKIKINRRFIDPVAAYHYSDVLVLSSVEDGLGLVVPEAMSCGLPVIVSDHVGAQEMVTDGVDGFIVPTRDAQALKEKISLLFSDKPRRRAMSQMALKKRELFDQRITSRVCFETCQSLFESDHDKKN